MKKKDIALIVAVSFFSGIFSLIIGHLVFAAPKNREQKVEVVEAITTQFPLPDSKYFNAKSINPTQIINIGENNNDQPFSGSEQ